MLKYFLLPENVQKDLTEKLNGYIIHRCYSDKSRFTIHGVDIEGEVLFCMADNLSFEDAAELLETLNKPFNLVNLSNISYVAIN
jgi:hypothetical protein